MGGVRVLGGMYKGRVRKKKRCAKFDKVVEARFCLELKATLPYLTLPKPQEP